MSEERRYNEQEIAAIFERAAAEEALARDPLGQGGLTRGELAHIAQDVGISQEALARALAAIDHTVEPAAPMRFAGVPVGIERTVHLTGPFTEADWDALVIDLHEVFGQPGETWQVGRTSRSWKNGQLHVYAEQTPAGHRVHFRTAQEHIGLGQTAIGTSLVFAAMGVFFMAMLALKGTFDLFTAKAMFVAMFSVLGLAGYGVAALRLPRRNEIQAEQVERLAAGIVERAAATAIAPDATEVVPQIGLDLGTTVEEEEAVRERPRHHTRQ